jgi:hypothetical protein
MATFTESPGSNLDYTFDWSKWLQTGETISSATVTAPDLLVGLTTVATTAVSVFLSGLAIGQTYQVKCVVTTTSARTDSRIFTLFAEQRNN